MEGKEALGLDVGGVILDFLRYRGTDLDFKSERYMNTPEVEGAVTAITKLVQGRFRGNVFLVSRVMHGPDRVLAWLRGRDFFGRTGIPESHFYHCAERHEKAAICQELGITHFVDDRGEVLRHLGGVVPNRFLFESLDEAPESYADLLDQVTYVKDWTELFPKLA